LDFAFAEVVGAILEMEAGDAALDPSRRLIV
jgi:hypothetical protein